MERCDVVDEFGNRTGRTVARGTRLGPGEFHPVVHVWIRDENGAFLIQQRAAHLETSPGMWATTAGYVRSGEDGLSAAIRETGEELGILLSPAQLSRFGQARWQDLFSDIWLADVRRDSIGSPTMCPEVSDWKWVSRAGLETLVHRGEFFAYTYIAELPA